MKISIRKSAIRDLGNIDHREKQKIYSAILELRKFPNIQNVKKLTNFYPAYRLRKGGGIYFPLSFADESSFTKRQLLPIPSYVLLV
uniref:ParE toxin of type II toxin-antitoxin system, parDE n=1 Tax=Candidatus Kentrum sp. LPFa TaxID=2126335 RepID=A0A450W9L8_9GAMM|nr:MAG: hypothetical protein BECKLPF1236B_GA0070989_10523 [Candidatus Kentron sp. LPFa]